MNEIAKVSLAGAVGALLVFGIGYSLLPEQTITTPSERIIEKIVERDGNLGALAEIPSKTFTIGGVKHYYSQMNFNTGTTTLCSIPVPNVDGLTSASTTLIAAGAKFEGLGTSTSGRMRIYKGIGKTSTTTLIAGKNITATGTVIMATTTLHTDATAVVGQESEYIIFDFQGGSTPYLGNMDRTGSCSAEFIEY